MFSVSEFTEGKYYVMTGPGDSWDDIDGTFDTIQEGVLHLAALCAGDYSVPEVVNSCVLTFFSNNQLDLVRDDKGAPIDGKQIYWGNTIVKNGEVIWEKDRE